MNESEQNVAIAEACGWTWDDDSVWSPDGSRSARKNLVGYRAPLEDFLPRYTEDDNAMRVARSWLTRKQQVDYLDELWSVCAKGRESVYSLVWAFHEETFGWFGILMNATASQHAEAFLRTVGKWKE